MSDEVVFYHNPNSRSRMVHWMLVEVGAPYRVELVNFDMGEHKKPAYLAVNPMGKVPAIVHNGALVTEQVAIFLYLADLYPEANLAPPIGDPLRGPYLRWMAYYGSCFEPAVLDFCEVHNRRLETGPGTGIAHARFPVALTLRRP